MKIEGRIIKAEKCIANKKIWDEKSFSYAYIPYITHKVYIKQLMTGTVYWAYLFDCKRDSQYKDVIIVDNQENFHLVA